MRVHVCAHVCVCVQARKKDGEGFSKTKDVHGIDAEDYKKVGSYA